MSTILLVDDNAADRAIFRRILKDGGHVVHELARGEEVFGAVARVRPHVVVLDVNLPDTDGHEICRRLRADPYSSGIPVLMLTVRDRREDVLAGLNAGADDYVAKDEAGEVILARVDRLANYRKLAALAVLNEQLAQVGRLLAGIVHEIRSPLSVIRGHAELMQITLGEDPNVREYLDPILRNCSVLQSRLEHLMAAVRTGPTSPTLMAVGPVVRESVDLFSKGIDPRGRVLELSVEVPDDLPPVVVDPGRLIQVLLNLLANAHDAILAARGRGRVTVRVLAGREDGSEGIHIEVEDDGPGVPAHVLPRLFEPFFTTKEAGSGFGLYLAHELIREQGGRLEAGNRAGGGASFSIWLPAATEAALTAGKT
jgi:signal transduction histidine kinase